MAPKVTSASSTSSAKSAGKRKAPAVDKATASSASKKQKDESDVAPKSTSKTAAAPAAKVSKAASVVKATQSPSPARKGKGKGKATAVPAKSPLTSSKPVQEDSEEDEEGESIDSEEEAEMLRGLSSDDEEEADGADSSDEDDGDSSDEDDTSALKRHSDIITKSLPSSKDDADVQKRLDKVSKQRQSQPSQTINTAVLYVGHLPKHFTEQPLRQYFSQFGTISRLRLSRNKKTGASKHYAFVEFADEEVGRIVQETMDNYLILGQLLKVKILDKSEIHPKLWIGANRTFRKVPGDRRARVQHDGVSTRFLI